jgi:hypothetical protein
MNDKKSKVSVTLTRKEAGWLLNLLDREARVKDPSTTPNLSQAKYGFQAASGRLNFTPVQNKFSKSLLLVVVI